MLPGHIASIEQARAGGGEVDLSEPEEIKVVKKRDEERATGADARHIEDSPGSGGQFHETEAQASMAQSDSTSPYSSEEITRLSALPEKPDTRFM